MEFEGIGELIPIGGGDAMPLTRSPLVMGRRESCDICLPFPNISGKHCELSFRNGYWVVRDLNSTNGIKINGEKLAPGGKKALSPGDMITIAKRDYKIEYILSDRMTRMEMMMEEEEEEDVMGVGLLEKAGLENPLRPQDRKKPEPKLEWDEDDDDD